MKRLFISCLTLCFITHIAAQCTADYDFGDETSGISPNPSLYETFAPGIINEPYEDILHFLVPQYVLDIDSTLPFSPTTLLDSIQLISFVMVDLNDTLTSYTFEELGLSISCNNNGDSGNSCSFHGGSQYCVDIFGTPTMSGNFRADLTIKGYVTIFGFPYGEEQLFGSLNLNLGTEGCMFEYATNYDTEAVIDDGSCVLSNICTADYDFGDETSGISPNPSLNETFAPGIINEPYEDILHFLVPQYVLDIDSTLPFSPTTLLDSIQLISFVMVDLNDTLTSYTFEELGLSISCNNNGDSGNSCSFHGGSQYCVDIFGTPTMSGDFRADLTIKGYVTIFGFPYGEEQLFGSLNLSIGSEGCMSEFAVNYDPEAVIDDGSCEFDNPCNVDGIEVATISYSYTETELTIDIGDLVYWVNYGGFHDVNGDIDSQTNLSFGNPEAFTLPSISGSPDGICMGSHTFTIPGIYTYDCSIGSHAAQGMVGTITVGVGGCLDSSASNYNVEANFDDGSCESDVDCLGDLNGDNSVTVADLLQILSEFGCTSGCTTDINNDGVTTVADLLVLLSVFGTTC